VHKNIYGQAATAAQPATAFGDLDEARPPNSVGSGDAAARDADGGAAARKSREAALLAVYGELWSWKEERILKASPFSGLREARLMPFIVKAGDDLRQEQLAIQLMSQFDWIFKEESVDVYLRPFTVMSISSDAGFVEVVPDAVSVHSLKKRTPNFVSLLDFFERAYGKVASRTFREAQRKFIRSMAGYSLVSYFLQIKDRHNGNIMLDAEGHVVHIDFGFMLTNSPGAIKFENVPFKLTEEYLQVICARKSVQDASETSKTEGYRYFQELFVLGLLAARKHYDKLTTLVEIMMEGTSMPCMSGGQSVVESLRHRFSLGVSEEQCIANALALIEESRLSWRSASYDRYQTLTNAIQ
jgi:phosphatidylinositol 4-kinase B